MLFQVCASFHSHRPIQTGVAVQKLQIWIKISYFFCPVWPWNLTDDFEKQEGTSHMPREALCIISSPYVNLSWSNCIMVLKVFSDTDIIINNII